MANVVIDTVLPSGEKVRMRRCDRGPCSRPVFVAYVIPQPFSKRLFFFLSADGEGVHLHGEFLGDAEVSWYYHCHMSNLRGDELDMEAKWRRDNK